MSSAVAVSDLRKAYGEVEAVRGISFEIASGEIFGLLGPNGAGKTTTVEILEGYRKRDAGSVTVLGADPARADQKWRERIGVVLQSSAMYKTLTVAESLALFPGYYEHPRAGDECRNLVGLGLVPALARQDDPPPGALPRRGRAPLRSRRRPPRRPDRGNGPARRAHGRPPTHRDPLPPGRPRGCAAHRG